MTSNKRMKSDQTTRYAPGLAADAERYVLVQILLIVSLMLLSPNEWHSKDLEGNEI